MSLPITPETRVAALLDAYPGIEDLLISWVPAFAKLKNPVLRKTVARVATLEQAARVGNLPLRELIVKLRQATGQSDEIANASPSGGSGQNGLPDWVREDRVRVRIDADAMLAGGEHPVGLVRRSVAQLNPGELVVMTVSFLPAPLVDTMRRGGASVHAVEPTPGRFTVYFMAAPA